MRGLVAVVLKLLSDRSPAEIAAFDARQAFARLGFAGSLSAQRSNGLNAMIARIKADAQASAGVTGASA